MSKSINLSRAIEGFLYYKAASGLTQSTINDYNYSLGKLAEYLQDPLISEITSKDLDRFFLYLRENLLVTRAAITPVQPRKLSPKTLLNIWGACSVFFKWVEREFNLANPFKIERPRARTKPISPFTKEEVEALFKACDTSKVAHSNRRKSWVVTRPTKKRDKALLSLLLDTGTRISEACGIKIGEVDFKNGRILVTGKGSKSRYVSIGRSCRQALWAYVSERYPKDVPNPDENLFLDVENWRPLNRDSARNLLKRLGEKAGIRGVHPHRFRHTFAIMYLRNGGDIFTLQRMLGHTSLDMVKHYLSLSDVDVDAVHQRSSPLDNWRIK